MVGDVVPHSPKLGRLTVDNQAVLIVPPRNHEFPSLQIGWPVVMPARDQGSPRCIGGHRAGGLERGLRDLLQDRFGALAGERRDGRNALAVRDWLGHTRLTSPVVAHRGHGELALLDPIEEGGRGRGLLGKREHPDEDRNADRLSESPRARCRIQRREVDAPTDPLAATSQKGTERTERDCPGHPSDGPERGVETEHEEQRENRVQDGRQATHETVVHRGMEAKDLVEDEGRDADRLEICDDGAVAQDPRDHLGLDRDARDDQRQSAPRQAREIG